MTDRHVQEWNIEEPSGNRFEDGCGCFDGSLSRLSTKPKIKMNALGQKQEKENG